MNELSEYTAIMNRLARLYPTLPTRAATVAVNFSKERFRMQNWVDRTRQPWPPRKTTRKSARRNKGKVLVDTGRLMRSVRKISATPERAVIGTDVEYARIHNDGGKIDKVEQVKTHRVRTYTRKRQDRRETVREHTVHAHARRVNMQMPQRRFIGQSAVLDRRIERMMQNELVKAIRNG